MGRCGTAGETVKARQSRRGKGAAVAAPFSAAEWVNRAAISGVALQVGRDQRLAAFVPHALRPGRQDPSRLGDRKPRSAGIGIGSPASGRRLKAVYDWPLRECRPLIYDRRVRKRPLSKYRSNTFSQNGEDGVIAELFSRIGTTNRYFCEFGAWDGRHLSNCFKLLTEGWSGLMIEGEPDRFTDLERTASEYPKLTIRHAFVDWRTGSDLALDKILAKAGAPADLDLLSIDIDGYDYQVWSSLERYRPRVVLVEINSAYPPGVEAVHPNGLGGSSFSSMIQLGFEKGYVAVAHTGNLFFVLGELASAAGIAANMAPAKLFNTGWLPKRSSIWRKIRRALLEQR